MFVDASAILAILLDEADGPELAAALEASKQRKSITSVLAVWEAVIGLHRRKGLPVSEAEARVIEFVDTAGLEMVEISLAELSPALQAFDRYGRHRHPEADRDKALNLADCFHYACARARRVPILNKDVGLALTDLKSVT